MEGSQLGGSIRSGVRPLPGLCGQLFPQLWTLPKSPTKSLFGASGPEWVSALGNQRTELHRLEARVTGRRGVGQTQRGPAGQGLGLQRDAGKGRNPRSGPPPKTGRSWHLRLRGAGVRLRGACVCVCVCPAKAVGNTRQMRSSLSSGTWPTAQPPAIRQHLSGAWSGTRGRRDSTHPFSPFCR